MAKTNIEGYLSQNTQGSGKYENRMIMLTDLGNNTFPDTVKIIENAAEKSIHLSLIGVSSAFQSQFCECFKNVKGFNYFCATNDDDLMKYIFHTFDFGFFSSAHNIELEIS